MNKKNIGLIALGLEVSGIMYQKVIAKHPLSCTCKTCVSIELSVPITAGITLSLDDSDNC